MVGLRTAQRWRNGRNITLARDRKNLKRRFNYCPIKKLLELSFFFIVLLEESLSQLTHRMASRFPYLAVGKVPGDTEHVLDYLMESDRLQARRYWSKDGENDLPEKLNFSWAPGSISFTLLFLSQRVRPSVKARVCEDMSMPVARGFYPRRRLFVAHRHSYTIVAPFMDHQLNGAHSQAVQSPIFFPPLEPCRSSLVVGMR